MNIFFSIVGILLLLYVSYRIIIEIRDNYENQREDQYTRELVQKLRKIDSRVDAIVDNLRFFEGDKSYTLDKNMCFSVNETKRHNNNITKIN